MMIGLCVAEKMAEEKKLEDKMMEEKKMEEMMMKEKKTDDLEPETLEQLVREARSNKNHKCCHQPKFCKNDKHCRNHCGNNWRCDHGRCRRHGWC